MSEFIDISRPLEAGTPPWPGDRQVEFKQELRIADGESVNLGSLSISLHNGTHTDAPAHYNDAGKTIDAVPPDKYIGAAQVIDVRGQESISIGLLKSLGAPNAPRLILNTGAWENPAEFPRNWPLMDKDVPAWLAANGVVLVGLDAPSVDAFSSKNLPRHHACGDADILILENLDLERVTPGNYELMALPLKITGADGSPVRAVLRRS